MRETRVRFAPSPTGELHLGSARTALFNWLFAKKTDGKFILRIEDTDEIRSTEESLRGIFGGLKWLGLSWDEGPEVVFSDEARSQNEINSTEVLSVRSKGNYGQYFQMERLEIYKQFAQKLLLDGNAYECYCTPEELEQMRKEQILRKEPPKYDGRCRNLSEFQRRQKLHSGLKPVIRFKMPSEGKTKFNDVIRGKVEFENALLDDFVIIKASGVPTYNFACVVDDYLMKITNVIRGCDHLSNTPRQIQLYKALKIEHAIPEFAHLSLILGSDGTRLSKRHGATSVLEYKRLGYLPEALFNYLALLGWSTEDSQQIFTSKEELISKFSLERCAKSPAIFDLNKLLWLNAEHIKRSSIDRIVECSKEFFKSAQFTIDFSNKNEYNLLKNAIELEKEKIKLLADIPYLVEFFFKEEIEYNTSAVEKTFKRNVNAKRILQELKQEFSQLQDFTASSLEKLCRDYSAKSGFKTSDVFHPLRVAVSGRMEGPGLFEMLQLMGKERVAIRIDLALQKFFL
ncbi:MAG: glutamate--tRNA ligase [Elusimicrobiota bacterium]|nr:glutamate--tRNA ligase [Elusimicrobiota bacterium]